MYLKTREAYHPLKDTYLFTIYQGFYVNESFCWLKIRCNASSSELSTVSKVRLWSMSRIQTTLWARSSEWQIMRRCLKAQVVCTTSFGHSASGFPSSKATTSSLTSEYEAGFYRHTGVSMPALRNPNLFRVRKPGVHSGILRRQDSHSLNSWGESDPFPYLARATMSSATDDFAFPLQPSTSFLAPHEPWQNVNPSWDFNFQTVSISALNYDFFSMWILISGNLAIDWLEFIRTWQSSRGPAYILRHIYHRPIVQLPKWTNHR